MMVLETSGLSKNYGSITAVNQLDLSIPSGKVFGLLGPNGSGKTTTLGMVLGVIQPTTGQFQWFEGVSDHHARKRVGAILEHPVFYPHLSGIQNLKISSKIKGAGTSRIQEVLDFVGLGKRGGDKFKSYSLGMKQRLSIASALIADPDVLILDEPTNGLDPEGIHDIRDLITRIAEEGKSIVLASHLLDEVQKVCTEYAVLQSGKCIHKGNVKEDLESGGMWSLNAPDQDALKHALNDWSAVSKLEQSDGSLAVALGDEWTGESINKAMADRGIFLSELYQRKNTLEQKFLELLKSNK